MFTFDPADQTVIFCPEEPELQIYAGGSFLKFTNGRLIIPAGLPGGEQIYNQLARSSYNFIFCHDMKDPVIYPELNARVMATAARKAWASNPSAVVREATFAIAAMTAQDVSDVKRMNVREIAAALTKIMPSAAEELLVPDDYEAEAKAAADQDMIHRSILANETEANAAGVDAQHTPAVDPDSPFAAIMNETEQPAPSENPFD